MMLLDLACFECLNDNLNRQDDSAIEPRPLNIPLILVNNSGIYEFTCDKGHFCITVIDNINFEILFEYGLNALVDDYYREAVSSFSSALERYYEFFIKTASCTTKNDFDSINMMWDKISNQSERQLGAYIVMYLRAFGELPVTLNDKQSSFRNSVIHKGKIPSKEEAVNFGNTVMHIIGDSLVRIKTMMHDSVIKVFEFYGYKKIGDQEFKKVEAAKGIMTQTLLNIRTTISVMHSNETNDLFIRTGDIIDRIPQINDSRKPRTYSVNRVVI